MTEFEIVEKMLHDSEKILLQVEADIHKEWTPGRRDFLIKAQERREVLSDVLFNFIKELDPLVKQ